MLIYFWGMEKYFYWGYSSIYFLGGWVEILGGDESPIPLGFAPLTIWPFSRGLLKNTHVYINEVFDMRVLRLVGIPAYLQYT